MSAVAPRIMIIEDDPWFAQAQAARLTAAGYTPIVTPHAIAAIKHIDDKPPHLIIADVLLPGGTVFSLLHELQSYSDTGGIPVIVCSNSVEQYQPRSLRPYGVVAVIDKATMHPDDIVTAVSKVLL